MEEREVIDKVSDDICSGVTWLVTALNVVKEIVLFVTSENKSVLGDSFRLIIVEVSSGKVVLRRRDSEVSSEKIFFIKLNL